MGASQYELLTLFADGGAMMYPLVLCSLIALGVIIAKFWTLWVAHRHTRRVLVNVEEAARAGNLEQAMEIASDTPGPTAAILLAGLRRIRRVTVAEGEVDQAVTTTGAIELSFLERGLVVLATVANVAPLMGFLGTVAGMILAFASIEAAGDVDPALVAGGIKVALLTTATGLAIAIPVNIAYNYFVTRIDSLILDMEQGTQQILNLAWDLEKGGKLTVVRKKKALRPLSGVGSRSSAVARGVAGSAPASGTPSEA
ncbi:MAG: MotA/TolQ/ExbB proton channel family protein [Gemmatimonadota bacterium]